MTTASEGPRLASGPEPEPPRAAALVCLGVAVLASALIAALAWAVSQRAPYQCTPSSPYRDRADLLALAGVIASPCGMLWAAFGVWVWLSPRGRATQAATLATLLVLLLLFGLFLVIASSMC
jgi:hypothetical protein